jgi:hypothetical protein
MRKPPLDDLDVKILVILDKYPFKSAWSIAETVRIGLTIVLWRLHDSIGFRLFHLHWVPYVLIVGLREKRIEYAQAMLPVLHVTKRDHWHHLVTSDESWFFLDTSPHRMSTLSRDNMITKLR